MEIKCPKCDSKAVLTTINDRWCRKCGYRSADKKEFEQKDD